MGGGTSKNTKMNNKHNADKVMHGQGSMHGIVPGSEHLPARPDFCGALALVPLERSTFHRYGLGAHACVLLCVVSTG